LLEEFDNIRGIIETAEAYGFSAVEALKNVSVAKCTIVGPTETEFIKVAAAAVDNRAGNTIDGETVMNAASVQLKCELHNGENVLLCGDASPDYLRSLDSYGIIQLPHHGQLDDAEVIFDKLPNAGTKVFLVSDNTGTGETSGGSDDLMKSAAAKGKQIKNTKKGVVDLPDESLYNGGGATTKSGIYVPSTQRTGGYGV
jgi:hypothetical protein